MDELFSSAVYLYLYHDADLLFQDCFFVSVVIRDHPELKDKPVAVCHSDNPKGTAEISSANYPARDYGWLVLIFFILIFFGSLSEGFLFLFLSI